MMVAVFVGALVSVGCSASDATTFEPRDPTPEQVETLRTSMTTWDAGLLTELDPSGLTEVLTPPNALIVGTDAWDLRVFSQKDPNNGCRLQVVDRELHDPCHGHAYRLDGTHIDPACERSLYEFAVEIVDDQIIVSTVDDGAPSADLPTCPPPVAVEH
jgi:nitrite reductase/ring-hydroxylating ferredoxin subunit